MDQYIIQKETLTGIADAIREKTNNSSPIQTSEFPKAIRGIAAAGSGGVEVPLLTVNFTVVGENPINIAYFTVVDNAVQGQQLYGVYNGSFQTIPNSYLDVWTDATPSMWGEDMYPTVSSSLGDYVGSHGADYSTIVTNACGEAGDVIEITFTTSL